LATCAASYNICFARSWCHTLLLVPEAPFARCAHSSVSVIERHTLFSLSNQKKREKKKRKKTQADHCAVVPTLCTELQAIGDSAEAMRCLHQE
jgi:hypothetical protein